MPSVLHLAENITDLNPARAVSGGLLGRTEDRGTASSGRLDGVFAS